MKNEQGLSYSLSFNFIVFLIIRGSSLKGCCCAGLLFLFRNICANSLGMVYGGDLRFYPLTGSFVQVLPKKYPNQPDGGTIVKGQIFEL